MVQAEKFEAFSMKTEEAKPRLLAYFVSGVVSTPCKARPELQHANHQERMGSHIWLTI